MKKIIAAVLFLFIACESSPIISPKKEAKIEISDAVLSVHTLSFVAFGFYWDIIDFKIQNTGNITAENILLYVDWISQNNQITSFVYDLSGNYSFANGYMTVPAIPNNSIPPDSVYDFAVAKGRNKNDSPPINFIFSKIEYN